MDHEQFPFIANGDGGSQQWPLASGREAPDREPGWMALRALHGARSDALRAVMLRASFKPIAEHDLVIVAPCHHCGDGGLRTAGSVKTRKGREQVRACDTCGVVEVGPLGSASVLKMPDTRPDKRRQA
jgi:hypothetical protein